MQGMAAIKQEFEAHMSRLEARMAAVEVTLSVRRKPETETDKKAPLLRKGESNEKIKKPLASLLGLVCTPVFCQTWSARCNASCSVKLAEGCGCSLQPKGSSKRGKDVAVLVHHACCYQQRVVARNQETGA